MIPEYWYKKVKKCPKCGITIPRNNGLVYLSRLADDICGRIWCSKCHRTIDVEDFHRNRYKVWKAVVDKWNDDSERNNQ